jgi:hypothetical protein
VVGGGVINHRHKPWFVTTISRNLANLEEISKSRLAGNLNYPTAV